MAYSMITKTPFGREALQYAMGNGIGHNGNEERNVYTGTINLLPGIDFADQMEQYWIRSRKNHKIQLQRIVQSFSLKEFDPSNPEDRLKANMIGQEFVRKHYPGRQAVVFTQIDGKGGKIHNHIFINDVSMIDYKGCTPEQTHYKSVEKWTDAITSEYTVLDTGKADPKEKATRTERARREDGRYVLKDDIRERVISAMNDATSEADFLDQCKRHGLGVTVKDNKSHGHYYTYELIDFSKAPVDETAPKNVKTRSYKLGSDYGYEALMERIRKRSKTLQPDIHDAGSVSGHHRKPEEPKPKEEEQPAVPLEPEVHPADPGMVMTIEPVSEEMLQDASEDPEPVPDMKQADETPGTESIPAGNSVRKPDEKKTSEMTHEERMIRLAQRAREQEERNRKRQEIAERNFTAMQREVRGNRKITSGTADSITERIRKYAEKHPEEGMEI